MLTIGLEGTQRFGQKLAAALQTGDCLTLKGDLGAGKTTLAESIIQALHGGDVAVISPTFNLLQTYDIQLHGQPSTVWHYDLYRLEHPEELEELALDEALEGGISIIEWPEIAQGWLPEHCIEIALEFAENNDNRNIHLRGTPEALARIKQKVEIW